MPRWLVVVAACAVAACTDSSLPPGCPPCASAATTCIKGGVCAQTCVPDAGNVCQVGQTCQATCAYCTGTECSCAEVFVCLPILLAQTARGASR
jgi:hypothetical protein